MYGILRRHNHRERVRPVYRRLFPLIGTFELLISVTHTENRRSSSRVYWSFSKTDREDVVPFSDFHRRRVISVNLVGRSKDIVVRGTSSFSSHVFEVPDTFSSVPFLVKELVEESRVGTKQCYTISSSTPVDSDVTD